MKKRVLKSVSLTLIFSLSYQLLFPLKALALTTGPSQPEMQGFEPVGTTEMVDLFTGDFVYNIPLFDIDGYPVNIAYHGGVTPEQDASWVGLGWSLNPGEINRTVRGLPDDFNGETLTRKLHLQEEINAMGKVGVEVGAEIYGADLKKMGVNLGLDLSLFMNANNYKGLSAGLRAGISASLGMPSSGNMGANVGFSPSIGIGSQSGVDLDASMSFSVSKANNAGGSTSASLGVGSGVNSRQGMRALNFNASISQSVTNKQQTKDIGKHMKLVSSSTSSSGGSFGSPVPIGIQNYVPVVTNESTLRSFYVQLKAGFEVFGLYPNFLTGISFSMMQVAYEGTRSGYGYMYLENAPGDKKGVLDFIRDKDGIYNKTIANLPMSSLAYDLYSVSGQGTGGSFRPFRNDVGTVYDPALSRSSENVSAALELGFAPNFFDIGGDVNTYTNEVEAGPWVTSDFRGEQEGMLYEKLFFKQGGELTFNNQAGTLSTPKNAAFSSSEPLRITALYNDDKFSKNNNNVVVKYAIPSTSDEKIGNGLGYSGTINSRSPRANLISVYTSEKASKGAVTYSNNGNNNSIIPYTAINNQTGILTKGTPLYRNTGGTQNDKISYISQLLPDGRRYNYGIPAVNKKTRDYTWGYNSADANIANSGGLASTSIRYESSTYNDLPAPERYFSTSETPAYAHAFLLTEVLSPDYMDITGNGCTDDDLGGFVKFNYKRTSDDYRWRAPAAKQTAHYDPGYLSDKNDGKASVTIGSREQWYLLTVESKNQVAEFYSTARGDAMGVSEGLTGSGDLPSASQDSYKLDSIRLFNKSDRYLNKAAAVPVKTIILKYDYSLCTGTPNSSSSLNPNGGKLTLKKLYIRYGNSHKNLLSPYQFNYTTPNPAYNYGGKDRWGYCKSVNPALNNFEFPYTDQIANPGTPDPATAYSLTDIILPSGGAIHVDYEADDYAYVQDKRAMEMLMVKGFGDKPAYTPGAVLYENKSKQFNYLYIQRRSDDGLPLSNPTAAELRKAYLEEEKHLYYSIATDIRGGAYEQIKGFAEIEDVGLCDNSQYFYVKLKKTPSSGIDFNPVALYAMNFAKYNINHIFYPGYGSFDPLDVLKAFRSAAGELKHMSKPHQTFVERGYCKNVKLAKSWVRVQSPVLSKKGGGVRVKRLTLSDNWATMSNSSVQKTETYGREYDYTIEDSRYGRKISSGVASNEPTAGGDENPLRKPVPYIADKNIALPAVEFYQLEPLGENFYPGGVVGYSSVKVRSIHIDKGKSSMSEEEHLFYTARDYPVRVEFTEKNTNSFNQKGLFVYKSLEQASQGYTLYLNDMHGKPKAIRNYLVKEYDAGDVKAKELVTAVTYHYNTQDTRLDSRVMTLVKENDDYVVRYAELGKETDLTFDSRRNYDNTESIGASANLNVVLYGIYPIPIPTIFPSYSQQRSLFHSMTATKIVQQYGILKKVEQTDHGATTVTENLVYDGETGSVLLSKTNNEYDDPEYTQTLPAYYGYEGMGPAYATAGFKEKPIALHINNAREGYLQTNNLDKYTEGDELLYEKGSDIKRLWVTKKGLGGLADYYGLTSTGKGYIAILPEKEVSVTITKLNQSPIVNAVQVNSQASDDPFHLNLVLNVNLFELPDDGEKYDITVAPVNDPECTSSFIYRIYNKINTLIAFKIQKIDCDERVNHDCNFDERPCLSIIRDATHSCCLMPYRIDQQCVLQVMPRNTYTHAANATHTNSWGTGAALPESITGFKTEIIRPGRRNLLSHTLQEVVSTGGPQPSNGMPLSDLLASSQLVSASARTYTDAACAYEGYDNSLRPHSSAAGNTVYEGYNDYVLGLKGIYRPLAYLVPLVDRSYVKGVSPPATQWDMIHSRKDGTFTLNSLYWKKTSAALPCGPQNYVSQYPSSSWQTTSAVTKYDMYGNGVEEADALGIYSSAQYGFNQKLPVSVVHNAKQGTALYEGFEDLNAILLHEDSRKMFYNFPVFSIPVSAYLYSPLAQVMSSFASATVITNADQNYYKLQSSALPGSTLTISTDAHTGTRALHTGSGNTVVLPVRTALSATGIQSFGCLKSKKYLFQFWQKVQGSGAVTLSSVPQTGSGSAQTITNFSAAGSPVNGWQLMQAEYDLNSLATGRNLAIGFPSNLLIDDIRVMPQDADMKSFVYDNLNNRLKAQLDENHYATLYEYDAEGQLVRVKKETEKGIITIRETRNSNVKNF